MTATQTQLLNDLRDGQVWLADPHLRCHIAPQMGLDTARYDKDEIMQMIEAKNNPLTSYLIPEDYWLRHWPRAMQGAN